MSNVKRDWDILTKEQKKIAIEEIRDYFSVEMDEEIGEIAAENLLEMFLQTIGKDIYNKGIDDSVDFLSERMTSLRIDMEALLKK